jgi:hypothetical protein
MITYINICEKLNFVWVAPERTASRMQATIFSIFGFKINNEPVFHINKYAYTHNYDERQIPHGYEIVCGARNPYSRVVSLYENFYKNNPANKKNFTEFLRDVDKENFVNQIKNPLFVSRRPNYLVRFENFKEDFMNLPFFHERMTEKQLTLMLKTNIEPREWQSYYTEESKEIVKRLCSHHIEVWGYEK